MKSSVLLGFKKHMVPIPGILWRNMLKKEVQAIPDRLLQFLTEDHHRVRELSVSELHRQGKPLPPDFFSEKLDLPVETVNEILDELEKAKVFLYRKGEESVYWAYPATADKTPHFVTYSTGEEGHAA